MTKCLSDWKQRPLVIPLETGIQDPDPGSKPARTPISGSGRRLLSPKTRKTFGNFCSLSSFGCTLSGRAKQQRWANVPRVSGSMISKQERPAKAWLAFYSLGAPDTIRTYDLNIGVLRSILLSYGRVSTNVPYPVRGVNSFAGRATSPHRLVRDLTRYPTAAVR